MKLPQEVFGLSGGTKVFDAGYKDHYDVGTEDEYPKKDRDAFVEAVDIYNKSHPE